MRKKKLRKTFTIGVIKNLQGATTASLWKWIRPRGGWYPRTCWQMSICSPSSSPNNENKWPRQPTKNMTFCLAICYASEKDFHCWSVFQDVPVAPYTWQTYEKAFENPLPVLMHDPQTGIGYLHRLFILQGFKLMILKKAAHERNMSMEETICRHTVKGG